MRRLDSAERLAAMLGGAGLLHFAVPGPYESIVPRRLGHARALVHASGVAEMAVAAAVAAPRTRRVGGLLAAALFVAVFPANVSMALDPDRGPLLHRGAQLRLPLQVPLVWWGWRVSRRAEGGQPA